MDLPAMADQHELASEGLDQLIGAVPGDRKSGAPLRPVGRERGHDDVSPWSDSAVQEVPVDPDLVS